MPVRAILDAVARVRAVEQRADGRLRLRARSYVPVAGDVEQWGSFGTDVADLIATIDWHLRCASAAAPVWHKMYCDILPRDHAQALREQRDRWRVAHDWDVMPTVRGTGRKRAMVGLS